MAKNDSTNDPVDLGLRAGRFRKPFSPAMRDFVIRPKVLLQERSAATYFDVHRAHAAMLARTSILTASEAGALVGALDDLAARDDFDIDFALDDFYANTERALIAMLGDEIGGKLHIGRSRNDLDATALRLKTRAWVEDAIGTTLDLIETLVALAAEHRETVLPEYTHLQHAQPGTLAHYFLGFATMLQHDVGRLEDALKRVNVNPLGSGAIGGTGFPIDRRLTADLLGFDGVVENSLAGVSLRDFAIEALAAFAMIGVDLSRIAEDFIAWCSTEFDMIELGDEFAGASSIMPQKKNPIGLETVRARAASVQGDLVTGLSTLKGTNLGHNWDCYEIDPALFSGYRGASEMLQVVDGVLKTTVFKTGRMHDSVGTGFSAVTELADLLVRSADLSFRSAHKVIGRVVVELLDKGRGPDGITAALIVDICAEMLGKAIALSEADVQAALDPTENVRRRSVMGGPASAAVAVELGQKQAWLKDHRRSHADRREKYAAAARRLRSATADLRAAVSPGPKAG